MFEGIVGRGHQSDVAIDEVKIENCGEEGGGQGICILFHSNGLKSFRMYTLVKRERLQLI